MVDGSRRVYGHRMRWRITGREGGAGDEESWGGRRQVALRCVLWVEGERKRASYSASLLVGV